MRLFPQGMVHKDGEVMSKSKGNTIAPDDVIERYGADTLRLYILFEAPAELALEWSEERIEGPHRFLVQRAWRLVDRHARGLGQGAAGPDSRRAAGRRAQALRRKTHQTIERVTADIDERIHLNTAVAAFHELLNEIHRLEPEVTSGAGPARLPRGPRDAGRAPAARSRPTSARRCGSDSAMPRRRGAPALAGGRCRRRARGRVELAVQVNGKVRGRISVPREAEGGRDPPSRLEEPRVKELVNGKQVQKLVVVPGRLVSVVVR